MAFPIAALITVLPELIKQINTRPKSGVKETSAIGIGTAITFIVQDITACSEVVGIDSLACVSVDHWSFLIVSVVALVARLNGKRKEPASE